MKPLSADDPPRAGEFRLRARLGAVYLGFSPAGRAVAVKVVPPSLAGDRGARDQPVRYHREPRRGVRRGRHR